MSQGPSLSQTFLAITRNPTDFEWLQGALAPLGQVVSAGTGSLDELLALVDVTFASVVFVGLDREHLMNQSALIEGALEAKPMLAIVALGDGMDNQLVLNAMRAGAAWKNIVPYFEVTGGGSAAGINETTLLDEYQRIDPSLSIEDNLPWVKRGSVGQAGDVRVRLSWNLPRLMFNPEELDVSSLMVAQKDVISTITQLYYERRRLQLSLLANPPEDPAARLTLEMRIEELTARLSGMTGGWFQAELDAALAEPEDGEEDESSDDE